MLRSAAVTIVQDRLGNRTSIATRILNEMILAQSILEHGETLPWFLLQNSHTSTVVSTQTVSLPTGHLRDYKNGSLWIPDDSGKLQPLEPHEVLDALCYDANGGFDDNTGKPTDYALFGSKWYLFPSPDAIYTLWYFAYIADTVLTGVDANETNLWLTHAPDILIAAAGERTARYLRDAAMVQLFAEELATGKARLAIDNAAREQSAIFAVMGG